MVESKETKSRQLIGPRLFASLLSNHAESGNIVTSVVCPNGMSHLCSTPAKYGNKTGNEQFCFGHANTAKFQRFPVAIIYVGRRSVNDTRDHDNKSTSFPTTRPHESRVSRNERS